MHGQNVSGAMKSKGCDYAMIPCMVTTVCKFIQRIISQYYHRDSFIEKSSMFTNRNPEDIIITKVYLKNIEVFNN